MILLFAILPYKFQSNSESRFLQRFSPIRKQQDFDNL
jgi:hypothetical protein